MDRVLQRTRVALGECGAERAVSFDGPRFVAVIRQRRYDAGRRGIFAADISMMSGLTRPLAATWTFLRAKLRLQYPS